VHYVLLASVTVTFHPCLRYPLCRLSLRTTTGRGSRLVLLLSCLGSEPISALCASISVLLDRLLVDHIALRGFYPCRAALIGLPALSRFDGESSADEIQLALTVYHFRDEALNGAHRPFLRPFNPIQLNFSPITVAAWWLLGRHWLKSLRQR
jgi:hypothetical protein